ncbi:hypothetical protein Pla52o_55390 [Novipirellula galeiformis]|uniref:Uncharacterized protein n=1 Tax=Novipirellula galeiformis TaxID=2528004 RepID=A0A5C6BT70_9BACT|nr:hypothetical protein Pla52o_55390 [Novipirellula galeiformis]
MFWRTQLQLDSLFLCQIALECRCSEVAGTCSGGMSYGGSNDRYQTRC